MRLFCIAITVYCSSLLLADEKPVPHSSQTNSSPLSNSGIGAVVDKDRETGNLKVFQTVEGGPAARAGLLANDEIVAINSENTTEMNLEVAVRLLRGKQGTAVRLAVRRSGVPDIIQYKVTRQILPQPPPAKPVPNKPAMASPRPFRPG